MFIQFLNKFRYNTAGSYAPSNLYQFLIDEGQVFTENYNETLDSATIKIDKKRFGATISSIDSPLDIEPYDMVLIYLDNNVVKKRLVDSVREVLVNKNPKIYAYEITLFSLVKELEGILLPNLRITQLYGVNKRSIGFYLNKYNNDYGPKVRRGNAWVNKYEFDSDVLAYFNQFDCPEMQWNQPTLREVFNDLMMVKDSIPYIDDDFKIQRLDLTEKKNDLSSDTHINEVIKSRDSTDYVSELKMNLVNVIQNNNNNIKNTVSKKEFLTFTAESGYIMTTDNITLKTKFPILKIKHLWMYVEGAPCRYVEHGTEYTRVKYTNTNATFVKVDLCNVQGITDTEPQNMIYEEKEWQTKNILYREGDLQSVNSGTPEDYYSFTELNKYQNTTLYYTRGSNEIKGFNNVVDGKWWFITWTHQNLEYYVYTIIDSCCSHDDFLIYEEDLTNPLHVDSIFPTGFTLDLKLSAGDFYKGVFFQIEYETMADAVFKAGRTENPSHKREINDNQTNSYVNPDLQGDLEYQKANRLGNPILMINAVYPITETNMMKIGDYYEDSVIYQVQYQYYKNYVNVNAYGTKDYILKNYFTGVKARIRSWRITDGLDASTRHNLEKIYCEFSYNNYTEFETPIISEEYLLSSLLTTDIKPLEYSLIRCEAGQTYYPALNQSYIIDFSMRLVGNSIVLTTGFNDNFEACKSIKTSEISISANDLYPTYNTDELGGTPIAQHRYVNSDGENEAQIYKFGTEFVVSVAGYDYANIETGTILPYDTHTQSWGTPVADFFTEIYNYGVVSTSNLTEEVFSYESSYLKDNNEIMVQSIQFEFCSDTTDLMFTKSFIERQEMIRNVDNTHTYKIKTADSSSYDFRNITYPTTILESANCMLSVINDKELVIEAILDPQYVRNKVCYLVDENNTILLAMNNIPEDNLIIENGVVREIHLFLNLLKDRDKNVYDDNLVITDNILNTI